MSALNVKISVSGRDGLTSIPVTDASARDMEDARTISAFGNESDARAFLRSNREDLAAFGFSDESEIQPLASRKTGEVIGAYLRRSPAMTSSQASSALSDLASKS